MKKLTCKILTPEKTLFEGEVEMVIVPAYDGELGILPGHCNLVAQLSCGECRMGQSGSYYVEGGVIKVTTTTSGEKGLQTEVILLSNQSFTLDELKGCKEDLEKELQEAKEMKVTHDRSYREKSQAVQSASKKLELLGKGE